MRSLLKISILAIAALLFTTSCNTRIDAGHEGILVKQYGTDKGVQDVTLVTGRVWYNPWTEDVYSFPTFIQTADYEAFTVNAKDGSIFNVDPMISYHVTPTKSPQIFKKYRKDIEDIKKSVLLNYVKDAFKNVFNEYTTDDILSKRQEFDAKVTKMLSVELEKEGFQVDQITFGMKYPESITKAIDAKNKAVQEATQVENELRVAEARAKIRLVQAETEAKANDLRQRTLTPLLIQQQFIEKWDGHTPLYGQAPTLFRNVQ
jgi:regulator of protease activity HflC (stomatin/prohibitin superfamily)